MNAIEQNQVMRHDFSQQLYLFRISTLLGLLGGNCNDITRELSHISHLLHLVLIKVEMILGKVGRLIEAREVFDNDEAPIPAIFSPRRIQPPFRRENRE